MGGGQNDIITILSDRDYMSNIKDKIKVIENCKNVYAF